MSYIYTDQDIASCLKLLDGQECQISQPAAAGIIRQLQSNLISVCQREAETQRRHDARVEKLEGINSKYQALIASLDEYFDLTFAPIWGPKFTYGDDADGNRGRTTQELESVEVYGLPEDAPKLWEEVLANWAMETKTF